MNQNLQNIVEIIQQSEKLDAEQKKNLIKAVKDADKELEITAFKLERTEKVKKTTAILLEETIEELEQKRKAVEKHNRELEIEAALERVRSRSMAMQKSEELKEVIQLVYEQFVHLKMNVDHAGFIVDYTPKGDWHFWIADEQDIPSKITHPYFESVWANQFNDAKEKGEDFFATNLNFEEKNKFYNELLSYVPELPKASKDFYLNCPGLAGSTVLLDNVGLYIENFSGTPYTDEENKTLMRFGKVFQQTYTRFLDLQRAEAQAREAQIEAALERVRARTMAMHKSDELTETAGLIFKQLNKLGIHTHRCNIMIIDEELEQAKFWSFTNSSDVIVGSVIPMNEHPVIISTLEQWKRKTVRAVFRLAGQDKINFIRYISKFLNFAEYKPENIDLDQIKKEPAIYTNFYFRNGVIIIHTTEENSEADLKIMERFTKVFEQTYTRFLDLQKAEAQAREAQIEVALERVRAKAMAMHSSNDISDTMGVVFTELPKLGISSLRCGVVLLSKDSFKGVFYASATTNESDSQTVIGEGDMSVHPIFMKQREYWTRNENYFVTLSDEELQSYYKEIFRRSSNPYNPKQHDKQTEHGYYFSFSEGMFYAWTEKPYTESDINILNRFKSIIDLTFRRYFDLKKAEAQAREAQIEAALERVRSRTMAMHKSDELADTVAHLFRQLNELGIKPYRCNLIIVDDKNDKGLLWATTNKGDVIPFGIDIPLSEYSVFNAMYNGWKNKETRIIIKLIGEERVNWINYINQFVPFTEYKPGKLNIEQVLNETAVFSCFFFKQGLFVIHTLEELNEFDLNIIQRFSNVFEQTYTRFTDLKKAEVQAREAVKQASLDRIRGEIASMRTADDLNRITPIIWRELTILEVPFIRCGVFIVNEEEAKTHVYLSTPDGKALGVLNLAFDANTLTSNTVEYWRNKEVYKEHWSKEEFINWTKSMMELGQVQNAETYQGSSTPPESLNLHFVPFTQGMLYVGDVSPLADEKLDLVKTLAEAFSIAYARYEDFRNLEEAKNKIEITLSELKSAQAQLIHSEKMASLGELTAGIAHEIKNPLNFVNNFSEISGELLDEIKVELEKNDKEEVLAILEDLKGNLEKINQHGKRADSIVKGMLLHSRGTSGEKALTDINDLLEQYVNLAYHGMRATNKEFNITIEKDYDDTLEKINVVPQDISRVFLNIINNACYAAYDKKKKVGNDFYPTLKVSTKNLKDKVEIRISDNGNGIPKDILDKIFQPFFTTKPTGEGTGLGLSLSYDIMTKVHNGELNVNTKEGEGSEFIIQLPLY